MGAFHRQGHLAGRTAFALLLGIAFLLASSAVGCGGGSGADRPTSQLEKRAQRIEERLAKRPDDARMRLRTMTAWIKAGDGRLAGIDTTVQPIPRTVAEDFRAGLRSWGPYLSRTGGEASADTAEFAGGTYFRLLEIGSTDLDEIESNTAEAARALRIAGRHRPDLLTLSNLAIYEYFNGEFAEGDIAAKGAAADVGKAERSSVAKELREYRDRAETFRGQLRRAATQLGESGDESLEEPLRLFASSTGLNKEDPSR